MVDELLPLESPCPHRPWWERLDPYWSTPTLFDRPPAMRSQATATTVTDDAGLHHKVEQPCWDTDPKRWRSSLHAPTNLRLMSTIIGWHHIDAFQLAAACGLYHKASSTYLKPLFELGLVRRGRYAIPDHLRRGTGRLPTIYSPERAGAPIDRWVKQLDDRHVRKVLGRADRKVVRAEPHARHNLIATEVGLRLCEIQPRVAAVWPEQFGTPRALLRDPAAPDDFEVDLVVERTDGLLVGIEVVASGDARHLTRKIDRWAQVLAGTTFAASGAVVVLLNCRTESHRKLTGRLRHLIDQRVTVGQLRHRNGQVASPRQVASAATMLHVASFEDWFPQPRQIAAAARQMATTVRSPKGRWQKVALADPTSTPQPSSAPPVVTPELLGARPPWVGGPTRSWFTGET